MQKHYRYFFYDFDGTLADTYPHIARAVTAALTEARGCQIDEGTMYDLLKISFQTAYDRYNVTDEEKQLIKSRHEPWDFEPVPTLFPHAEDILREGLRRGCCNVIYTNRGETVYEYLERLGVLDCFSDFILHADKPNHESLLHTVEQRGWARGECVVIGDREVDMLAARTVGIDGILFDPNGRVEDRHGAYVIRSMQEMLSFFI